MTRKNLIFLLVLVIALGIYVLLKSFIATSKDKQPPEAVVTLGVATWPGFAIGIVGMKKGFFDGLTVRTKVLDDLPTRHAAFRSGDIDVMASSVDLFVQERSQGVEGQIAIVTDFSYGGDGIIAKHDMHALSDLKGKRIAFARATPSHYLLYKALVKAGMTPADITQIKVEDPSHAGEAFVGGSVDAAVTWEPLLTEVKKSGKGHVLVSSKDIPDAIVDILVASPSLLNNKNTLYRLVAGWKKSAAFVLAHPDESARLMAEGLGIKEEDTRGMMAGLRFADEQESRDLLCNQGAGGISSIIKDARAFWISQGIIPTGPNAEVAVSQAYCEK